jgi:hypothetical protein
MRVILFVLFALAVHAFRIVFMPPVIGFIIWVEYGNLDFSAIDHHERCLCDV